MAQRRPLDPTGTTTVKDQDPANLFVVENGRESTSCKPDDAKTDAALSAGARSAFQSIGG